MKVLQPPEPEATPDVSSSVAVTPKGTATTVPSGA